MEGAAVETGKLAVGRDGASVRGWSGSVLFAIVTGGGKVKLSWFLSGAAQALKMIIASQPKLIVVLKKGNLFAFIRPPPIVIAIS